MKRLILFFILFCSLSSYSQNDSVYAVVTQDSVIIKDYNAQRTCGSKYFMSIQQKEHDITLFETDTAKVNEHQHCYCNYNMHCTIKPLSSGSFNVYVKKTGIYFDTDTVLVGTTSFDWTKKSKSDSSIIISQFQSECEGLDNDFNVTNVQNFKIKNYSLLTYPNPLTSETTISYRLDKAGYVVLKLYDFSGREVANLINNNMLEGTHNLTYNFNPLKSGMYFLCFIYSNKIETSKINVIKN